MDYRQTLDYLFSRLPMFHRTGPAAYKDNLENTYALDNYFNHPHRNYKTIHIAGTNGKGSVSHMLAAILQSCGYKTGLYTSPHLVDFRERIRVNGKMIDKESVCEFIEKSRGLIDEINPSFFELSTLMAFEYFSRSNVDFAVIETGMGGRLDSTNVINPVLSIITNIGLDHTQFLGDTLQSIAREKAGIIKKKTPVVIGEWQKETEGIFIEYALRNDSPVSFASGIYSVPSSLISAERKQVMQVNYGVERKYDKLEIDLLGIYQKKNICTVLQSVDSLKKSGITLPEEGLLKGLSEVSITTGLRGRWEMISCNPLVVCDTGHNAEGILEVMEQVKNTKFRSFHMILGLVSDKDPDNVLSLLPVAGRYYFTRADIPRAMDPDELKKKAGNFGLEGKSYKEIPEAYKAAKKSAQPEDLILIGGSSFVVGDFLRMVSI